MNCFNLTFTTSDIIQLFGIIASLISSIVAIIISLKTLKQNSKMIEESTKPSIQIYPVHIGRISYIIIKNFGQSTAYIDEIFCNHKFSKEETLNRDFGENIFDLISGAILSPGYSIKCPLVAQEVSSIQFNFKIKYHSTCKNYEETFCFNCHSNFPFANVYPNGNDCDDHLKSMSRNLSDLVKMQL